MLTSFLSIVPEVREPAKGCIHTPKLGPSLTNTSGDHAAAVNHRALLSHGQTRSDAECHANHLADQCFEPNDARQVDPVQEALDLGDAGPATHWFDVDKNGSRERENGLVEQEREEGGIPEVEPVIGQVTRSAALHIVRNAILIDVKVSVGSVVAHVRPVRDATARSSAAPSGGRRRHPIFVEGVIFHQVVDVIVLHAPELLARQVTCDGDDGLEHPHDER